MTDVTQILQQIDDGDRHATEELLPLVYNELKTLASARMSTERPDHTLQATALVHEAFLRLVGTEEKQEWNSRGHFFGAAAEAMRRILVEHARKSRRLKRGGDAQKVALDAIDLIWQPQFGDLLEIHEILEQFQQVDPEAAELVKLRCFAGQTQLEAAALLGISKSSADRLWAFARAWIYDAMNS